MTPTPERVPWVTSGRSTLQNSEKAMLKYSFQNGNNALRMSMF